MNGPLVLLLGIAVIGAVYFLLTWIDTRRSMQQLTALEVRNAQIAEDLERERKGTSKMKLQQRIASAGYDGDWISLAGMLLIGYLVLSFGLTMVGASQLVSLAVALPVAALGAYFYSMTRRRKRYALFEHQLLQAVRIVAAQLESGDTPQMAFQKAAMLVEDPLHTELDKALASRVGTDSLASVIAPLADRYPSQAMNFLITALEIDDKLGTRLAPALRQAQYALEHKMELSAEATAEISQSKAEFFGLTIIIGAIAVVMLYSSKDMAGGAYTSPMGIIVLTLTGANYIFGIFRTLKIFRKAAQGS
jgi:tight adherence protein B